MAFGSTNANGHLAAELDAHTEDKGNPHGVTVGQIGAAPAKHSHTPEEVGLGAVENKAIGDQTPAYGESETLAPLTPGEKLSAALGKIAKAIKDLIAHIGNKNNPHGVTVGQIGAAASNHRHTASDVGAAPSDHTHKGMVTVLDDGVVEVGRYLDFHETGSEWIDYNVRVDCGTGAKQVLLALPHKNGVLATTGDIPKLPDMSRYVTKAACAMIALLYIGGYRKLQAGGSDTFYIRFYYGSGYMPYTIHLERLDSYADVAYMYVFGLVNGSPGVEKNIDPFGSYSDLNPQFLLMAALSMGPEGSRFNNNVQVKVTVEYSHTSGNHSNDVIKYMTGDAGFQIGHSFIMQAHVSSGYENKMAYLMPF